MTGSMWAAVRGGDGHIVATSLPRPEPAVGEVLLRVLAAGLAPASLSQGSPRIEIVAVVEGGEVEGDLLGKAVVVTGTLALSEPETLLAAWVSVPATAVLPLPAGRALEEAVLLPAAAAALAGVRAARVQIGESVAVVGTGVLAALAAQWVRVAGAYDVFVSEQEPSGRALARKLWLGELIPEAADAADWVHGRTGGAGVDLALAEADDTQGLALAASLVREGGRVLALGHTGGGPPAVDRALPLLSPAPGAPLRDWALAARTWSTGRLALRDLVAYRAPAEELPALAGSGLRCPHDWRLVLQFAPPTKGVPGSTE